MNFKASGTEKPTPVNLGAGNIPLGFGDFYQNISQVLNIEEIYQLS